LRIAWTLFVNYTPKNWDGYSGFKSDDVIPLRNFSVKSKEEVKSFLLKFVDGLALISKHYSAILKSNNSSFDETELNLLTKIRNAGNIANREMKKDEQLFSSYDQYSKIKASNLSLNELKKFENIQADNIDSLNKKLYDFVGADGKYMPFTKSVTIKLNNENLKDIEIIDTPGINDPIASREERTKELLKNCDVIFVVSPSGQFLSSEDIDLLDRITKKEGIQEIYIIASQIDNQLYGSEKEKTGTKKGSDTVK
jgi:hypothetical protein